MAHQPVVDTDRTSRIGPLSEWPATPTKLIEQPIGELLAQRAAEQPDRPLAYWRSGDKVSSISYREVAAAASAVASALVDLGEPGTRTAVWSRNSIEWIIVEYAAALAGHILTPFNTAWTDAEVSHGLSLTRPSILFHGRGSRGESLSERARALAGQIPVVPLDEVIEWAGRSEPGALPSLTPDAPFLIQFTSGTTGRAKGALLSQRAALNCAYQRNRAEVIVDNDCYCNPVPFHHVGGSCSVVLGGLADGGAIVLLERWAPDEVVRLLEDGVATRVGGVPTMMIDLLGRLEAGEKSAADYHLASVSVGGAQVPEFLIHKALDVFGAPVVNTYAQSECPMITTTSSDDEAWVISTTVGRPAGGVELKIVDLESGHPVPVGEPGEIVVRAPYMMLGYWDMPEQSAAALTSDGFLHTGDLATMDEFGNITFRGRSRDVIIRGGENIYPAEIEDIVAAHPGVASVVIVGLDDARLGEQPAGVVVRKPGSTVTAEELTGLLDGKISRFKMPVEWRFVEQFPMTASGKVRRFLVRQDVNQPASD